MVAQGTAEGKQKQGTAEGKQSSGEHRVYILSIGTYPILYYIKTVNYHSILSKLFYYNMYAILVQHATFVQTIT